MKIKNITAREIFDSRAKSTIEVEVENENLKARASAPQGKSKGSQEAVSLGFEKASEALNSFVLPAIEGKEFETISELDNFLLELDGTKNKSKLGGDLMLGISIAFARLLAKKENKELWEVLRDEFFESPKKATTPKIFANLINGGEHADNNLAFQEYMVVAGTEDGFTKTTQSLISFYEQLREHLQTALEVKNMPLGDEAGFSTSFSYSNEEPILVLEELVKKSKLNFKIALDVAANSFYENETYTIDEKKLNKKEFLNYYSSLFEKSELLYSIEDPFDEKDFEAFGELKKISGDDRLIVGDDLTTTNPKILEEAIKKDSLNAIIIKANQVGTLTETAKTIIIAQEADLKTIISHRSGETEDCFLAHIAKASNAYGVKIGAPQRERILKYNELIRLYKR